MISMIRLRDSGGSYWGGVSAMFSTSQPDAVRRFERRSLLSSRAEGEGSTLKRTLNRGRSLVAALLGMTTERSGEAMWN
jgi:hypothetical protein